MLELEFDGKCHVIPEAPTYGYIANIVGTDVKELNELIEKQIKEFARYLYKYDQEEVIRILTDLMRCQIATGHTPERYQSVHRPPWIVGALAQCGTITLKFKRAEKDDLERENESQKSFSNRCF